MTYLSLRAGLLAVLGKFKGLTFEGVVNVAGRVSKWPEGNQTGPKKTKQLWQPSFINFRRQSKP